jgi:hypothetical protein
MENMWHRISKASPIKRFVYTFLGAYIIALIILIVSVHRLLNPGPFAYAGIGPIPGAEVISHASHRRPPAGSVETWVLEIPKGYYEKLYKDCSAIGYLQGPYLNPATGDISAGTGIDGYLDRNAPSCYSAVGDHFTVTVSEFRGNKLIVLFDNSFPL